MTAAAMAKDALAPPSEPGPCPLVEKRNTVFFLSFFVRMTQATTDGSRLASAGSMPDLGRLLQESRQLNARIRAGGHDSVFMPQLQRGLEQIEELSSQLAAKVARYGSGTAAGGLVGPVPPREGQHSS